MSGLQTIPFGEHHPNLRWGYYNADGSLVRELAGEEIPAALPLVNPTYFSAQAGPGFVFRDPTGEGYYLCFWVAHSDP